MKHIEIALREEFYSRITDPARRPLMTTVSRPFRDRSIVNINDVKLAVTEVHSKPFTPRTIKGHGGVGTSVNPLLTELAVKIHKYFNDDPNTEMTREQFDTFHHDLCSWFMTEYNRICAGICEEIAYGRAQKQVNMVFKYLSCYGDYDMFAAKFEHCHMPIDGQILEGLEKELSVEGVHAKKYCGTVWSKLSPEQYLELTANYRAAIAASEQYRALTALHTEYYLW